MKVVRTVREETAHEIQGTTLNKEKKTDTCVKASKGAVLPQTGGRKLQRNVNSFWGQIFNQDYI